MALQSIININVDFYDKKYILINAKQYDKSSRFVLITCYNHGELYPINSGEHSAYIRYEKSDNNAVFNFCEIDRYGKIKVELTEQMLSSDGICCADLVIVNKGSANVDTETGEIIAIDNASILSTMPIHIDVTETAVNNSDIESTYEFNALNKALEEAMANYENVIKLAKSYAVGGTGVRDNEESDNSKYYSELSLRNLNDARQSAANALQSENNAKQSEIYAKQSENNIANVIDGLNSGFIPMGTISFSELSTVTKATGYTYNINEDFVTNETFREGAGKSYTAGTNVYYTNDNYWDCFGGAASPTATVDEVKEYLGINDNGTIV